MRDINGLNIKQTSIVQALKFMYKAKHNLNSRLFDDMFTEIYYRYPTRFCRSNLNNQR